MPWWGWLIIGILAFLIAAIVVLFIFGRRMQRKQADTEKQMEAMKQQVSILVIDKQKKRMIDSGLPDAVIQQTPQDESAACARQDRTAGYESDRGREGL